MCTKQRRMTQGNLSRLEEGRARRKRMGWAHESDELQESGR